MDKEQALREIFDNDPLGLLNLAAKTSAARTDDERLVASFLEIVDFYEKNNKEPKQGDMQETQLMYRLQGIRENEAKIQALLPYDRYNLLTVEKKEINSIEDIFNDDSFGLLGSDAEDLFDLKHVSKPDERESPDMVAKRTPCENFEDYEPLFKACQADLKTGKRKQIKFVESALRQGVFFVLNGVLGYLEKVHNLKKDKNSKIDGRTRCIFENGTESDMLLRSLGKGLYENGYLVTEPMDRTTEQIVQDFSGITEEDQEAGFIYVLRSDSTKPEIMEIQHLYKIGFSKTTVEDRIKNAEQEPTYLMAAVRVVTVFKCYNMNPQKLEQLLHRFFGNSCLNIDVFDNKGRRHTPREWFIAPLYIIEQAVKLIETGAIVKYKYDSDSETIVER